MTLEGGLAVAKRWHSQLEWGEKLCWTFKERRAKDKRDRVRRERVEVR